MGEAGGGNVRSKDPKRFPHLHADRNLIARMEFSILQVSGLFDGRQICCSRQGVVMAGSSAETIDVENSEERRKNKDTPERLNNFRTRRQFCGM